LEEEEEERENMKAKKKTKTPNFHRQVDSMNMSQVS
jgi:hypothetical protein